MTATATAREMDLTPRPEHRFTFGLWTVATRAATPSGTPTRPPLDPVESCIARRPRRLRRQPPRQRPRPVRRRLRPNASRSSASSRGPCSDRHGGPHGDDEPVHASGVQGRRLHLQRSAGSARYASAKTMRAIDLGAELGAEIYVFWGGREGAESDAASMPATRSSATARRLNFLCEYVRRPGLRPEASRIEPKPNEPRGDIFLPTIGHALAFIDHARSPRDGRRQPRGRPRADGRAQLRARGRPGPGGGKLFHIDLNGRRSGATTRTSASAREDLKEAFFLVNLLEDIGYTGARHFDATPIAPRIAEA